MTGKGCKARRNDRPTMTMYATARQISRQHVASINVVRQVLVLYHDEMFRFIANGGQVQLGRLGIIKLRVSAQRNGYDVAQGERVIIPAHRKAVFQESKTLKRAVRMLPV